MTVKEEVVFEKALVKRVFLIEDYCFYSLQKQHLLILLKLDYR